MKRRSKGIWGDLSLKDLNSLKVDEVRELCLKNAKNK